MLTLILAALAIAPQADSTPQKDQTLDKAGDIASQPARDVGAIKRDIPLVLQRAQAATYVLPDKTSCPRLAADIAELDKELGRDFDLPAKKGGEAGRYAEAGGKFVVNTIIPFRGLVREVSGAAAADRRLETAKEAGLARRGFLRGVQASKRCKAVR